MKITKIIAVASAAVAVWLLITAFVNWGFDPSSWTQSGRVIWVWGLFVIEVVAIRVSVLIEAYRRGDL